MPSAYLHVVSHLTGSASLSKASGDPHGWPGAVSFIQGVDGKTNGGTQKKQREKMKRNMQLANSVCRHE